MAEGTDSVGPVAVLTELMPQARAVRKFFLDNPSKEYQPNTPLGEVKHVLMNMMNCIINSVADEDGARRQLAEFLGDVYGTEMIRLQSWEKQGVDPAKFGLDMKPSEFVQALANHIEERLPAFAAQVKRELGHEPGRGEGIG